MATKKSRVGSKAKAELATPIVATGKTNNTTICKETPLAGLEDIAHYDDAGVPFILVDGACIRSREDLHEALLEQEAKRMKRIMRKCGVPPLVEYHKVPWEWKMLSSDSEFEEDMQLLRLDQLQEDIKQEALSATGRITPIPHAPSAEDLHQSSVRMTEIRKQLAKLRQQQQQSDILIIEPQPVQDTAPRAPYRRQNTFDIQREKSDKQLAQANVSILHSKPVIPEQRVLRAASSSSQLSRSKIHLTVPKVLSSTCLSIGKSATNRLNKCQSGNDKKSAELPQTMNETGELPEQPDDQLDTIATTVLDNNCNVEPIISTSANSQLDSSGGNALFSAKLDNSVSLNASNLMQRTGSSQSISHDLLKGNAPILQTKSRALPAKVSSFR